MRFNKEHLKKLELGLEKSIINIGMLRLTQHRESLKKNPRVKCLETRLLWDLYYTLPDEMQKEFRDFANDNNITTALKKVSVTLAERGRL